MANFGDILSSLTFTAGQSVRRNAGDTAFEVYTPLRVTSVAAPIGGNITPNVSLYDLEDYSANTANFTFVNPSVTPKDGEKYIVRIKSNGVYTVSYGTKYAGSVDMPLPTATTGSNKVDFFLFTYHKDADKMYLIAKNFGF